MSGKRITAFLIAVFVFLACSFVCPDVSYAASDAGKYEKRAEALMNKMTTKEKVAQLLFVAMPAEKASSIQKKYQFGGYILFDYNFKQTNRKGLKKQIASCQKKSKIPMLIGTDEEGGTVVRASLYISYRKSRFRSPRNVYRSGGYKGITKDTKAKDRFLKSLGINCNLVPVADTPYRTSDFMYDRAFSCSPGKNSRFIKLAVKQMGKDKVVSVLKHYPGYGNNGDTHGKIIRDKRSGLTIKTRDIRPFRAGIKAGTDMIMVSHTIVYAFDKKRPASLSSKAIKYLRKDLGFEGVIITDGLDMKGITDHVGGSRGKAAVKAIKAGNDMICATGDYESYYKALVKAVKSGKISEKRLNASVKRILVMKLKRGLL